MKNFGIGILIILIVIGTSYSIYYQIDKFNNNDVSIEDINKENTKENNDKIEILDINDKVVQNLLKKIEDDSLINLIINNKEVYVNDISPEIKDYLGYRQVSIIDIKNDLCENYNNIINPEINKTIYGCGDEVFAGITMNDYIEKSLLTNYIEEEVLKKEVEEIFGNGTYQRTEYFHITIAGVYLYDSETSRYVYGVAPIGGTGLGPTKTLLSAEKTKDTIKIVENAKIGTDECERYGTCDSTFINFYNVNIEYTFKLINGDYYFYSAISYANSL